MKVAIIITGIARDIEKGYLSFYKNIIERYDTDLYVFVWDDYESNKILNYYNPKKIKIVEPIDFSTYDYDVRDEMYVEKYGGGSFYPMVYCWQKAWEMLEDNYDCVIRSRFDIIFHHQINLESFDLSKIHVSDKHWGTSNGILDDNFLITNFDNSKLIFGKIFDKVISKKMTSHINEINFTNHIKDIGLFENVQKSNLNFDLTKKIK